MMITRNGKREVRPSYDDREAQSILQELRFQNRGIPLTAWNILWDAVAYLENPFTYNVAADSKDLFQ